MTALSDSGVNPRRRAFVTALFFVAGLATVFIALGATASALGQALARYKDLLAMAGGAVILVFGLHFLGILRIPFLCREARVQGVGGGGTRLGAYAMGLAFAFGWTPCVGPVLAAVLFQAAQAESLGRGVGLLAAYSAGLGIPFLLAALFITPFLGFVKRFRRSLGVIEKVMGGILVVVGLLFLTGGFTQLSLWMLENMPFLAQIETFAPGAEGLRSGGIDVGYPAAFFGGLLSFLSPCVLPLAPPYLAYVAGMSLDEMKGDGEMKAVKAA